MSSSSSSSLSGLSRAPAAAPSFSDLLVHFGGEYKDWLPALRRKAAETLDETCAKSLLSAQVNCWQVMATRQLAGCCRLPSDVTKLLCEFLGPVPRNDERDHFCYSTNISSRVTIARSRDRFAAMQYYYELLEKVADTGADYLEITEQLYEAAPRSALGERIHPALVAQYFSEKHHFDVTFGPERTRYNTFAAPIAARYDAEEFPYPTAAAEYFPLRLQLTVTDDESMPLESTLASLKKEIDEFRTNGHKKGRKDSPTYGNLGTTQIAFVKTVNAGVEAAAEYIIKLAEEHFAKGNCELLFTEELWHAAPRLPNGKLPPLWPCEEQKTEFCGGSEMMPEFLRDVSSFYYDSGRGIHMEKKNYHTGEPHSLPVRISLN